MGQLTKQFGKIKVEVEIPHLLNLQVDSYRKFMQEGRTERLPDEGLEGVFRSVFPIEDFNRTASLEFVSYEVGEPKYRIRRNASPRVLPTNPRYASRSALSSMMSTTRPRRVLSAISRNRTSISAPCP